MNARRQILVSAAVVGLALGTVGLYSVLGEGDGVVATLARNFGWAFAWWGIGLYWWAGVLYAWQVRTLIRETPRRTSTASDHG